MKSALKCLFGPGLRDWGLTKERDSPRRRSDSELDCQTLESTPQVSVVIPAYNAGLFIETAIKSCLIQNYSPLDIIVVDDGSTDNTAVLVRRIQSVRLIQLPSNRGAAEALNIGFRGARGEFVCWLSADDAFVFPDKIMKQVEEMRRTEADWSYYTESYVGRSMDEARLFEPFSNCLMKFPRLRVFAIMVHNPINGSSIMLRRSSLKKYGTFDPTLKNVDADGELWMRWASKGAKLAILNGPGVFYRTHKGQTSRKRVNQRRGQLLSRARFMLRGLRN